MKIITRQLAHFNCFIILSWLLWPVHVQATAMYRWVDEEGRVYYSYTIPPEATKLERSQLNKNGLTVKTMSAAKTKEQIAEEKWLAELKEKLRKIREKQMNDDRRLLSTYSDVEQLDNSYLARLKTLDDTQKQVEVLHDKLKDELKDLQAQLSKAKELDSIKRLKQFILDKQAGIDEYAHALNQNTSEKEKIKTEYKQQRSRFLELLEQVAEQKKAEAAKSLD